MKIEDVIIEDAADANYVIRKYFNDDLKNIKVSQLEQLLITVYNMGKKNSAPCCSENTESSDSESAPPASLEPPPPPEPIITNPFKVSDRVKAIEDFQIGKSGEFVKANTVGTVTSVNGELISFLFEHSEDGEMMDVSGLFSKFEKV